MLTALIITKGFHPPWNQGEVVATRNFVKVLSRIYDKVLVLSLIDRARGFESSWKPNFPNVKVVYVNTVQSLASICGVAQSLYDLHVANISLLDVSRGFFRKANRIYLYLYALKNVRAISTIFRTLGLLLGSTVYRKLQIITTSPMVYRVACKLHSNTFYVPTPIEVPASLPKRDTNVATILCLTHADYVRFPIDKIMPAIAMLVREGFKFHVSVVFSQAFKDYQTMLNLTRSILDKYGLRKVASVPAKDLGEKDKQILFTGSHIFLYPALCESAVDPPLTILEAMAYGLCIVATKVQSIPYVVGYGKRGILLSRPTSSNLYRALKVCLVNKAMLIKHSYNAWLYIRQVHDETSVAKYLEKLIHQR